MKHERIDCSVVVSYSYQRIRNMESHAVNIGNFYICIIKVNIGIFYFEYIYIIKVNIGFIYFEYI